MIRPNSKKSFRLRHCYTEISFGYRTSRFDYGNGHFTRWHSYSFLFWTLQSTQAFVEMKKQSV